MFPRSVWEEHAVSEPPIEVESAGPATRLQEKNSLPLDDAIRFRAQGHLYCIKNRDGAWLPSHKEIDAGDVDDPEHVQAGDVLRFVYSVTGVIALVDTPFAQWSISNATANAQVNLIVDAHECPKLQGLFAGGPGSESIAPSSRGLELLTPAERAILPEKPVRPAPMSKRSKREQESYAAEKAAFEEADARCREIRLEVALGARFRIPADPRTMAYFGEYVGLVTPEEVIANWRQAGNLGTELHRQIEWYLNAEAVAGRDGAPNTLAAWNAEHGFQQPDSPEWRMFTSWVTGDPWAKQQEWFRTEWRLYDPDLLISGTIDAASVAERKGGKVTSVHLVDWKRTKDIHDSKRKPGWLKAPLDTMEASHRVKYSLQLNLYRFLLKRMYDIDTASMRIAVFHPNYAEPQIIKVPDLGDKVEVLVRHYVAMRKSQL